MLLTSRFIVIGIATWFAAKQVHAQNIQIIGEMKQVMWQGDLSGKIDLDTITDKQHLYGLGPLEGLKGELLILDGTPFISTVLDSHSMKIENSFQVKAPFFAYANIAEWEEQKIPESVFDLKSLEAFLLERSKHRPQPFFFKITGHAVSAHIHVVNLPEHAIVRSPAEAHAGLVDYFLEDQIVEILGFFSTEHRTIFTHHDTYLHLHLINNNYTMMGHVDDLLLQPTTFELYLPK